LLKTESDTAGVFLEVGCGRGVVVKSLKDSGFDVHGVELADVTPVEGAEQMVDSGIDVFEWPIERREKITGLLLLDVIEHLPEPEQFLKRLESSFPKLRVVIITVPTRQEIWSNFDTLGGHYRRYTLEMLEQLSADIQWTLGNAGYFFRLPYLPMRVMSFLGIDRNTKFDPPATVLRPFHRLISGVCQIEQAVVPRRIRGSSAYAVYYPASAAQSSQVSRKVVRPLESDLGVGMYQYNEEFYRYLNLGAEDSAMGVIPELLSVLPCTITSVLDVGCAAGAWLSVWKKNGCEVTGLDGEYVERSMLLIDADEFRSQDLAQPFDLGRRFDLCQSLEVAEHIPATAAAQFIRSLCASSDIVFFSAAAPGQGGENHINEQPYKYWQALFEQNSYQMYDPVRDKIAGKKSVMPWYRFNTFLYVNRACLPEVHERLAEFRIEPGQIPKDKSPVSYRARKALTNAIPVKYRTRIAVLKKKSLNTMLKWGVLR
jgi:2-polyprenyl-3-methyl-5-hydroxy-6-metoxy-1,4-benzoquinol methylase